MELKKLDSYDTIKAKVEAIASTISFNLMTRYSFFFISGLCPNSKVLTVLQSQ